MSQVRRAFYFQMLGLAAAAIFVVWLTRTFPVLSWIGAGQRAIADLGPAGAVLYPLLYAACNLLLLPAGVLAVGSGLFFGLWWGFVLNLAGNVLGAAVAFLLSRRIGRGWVRRKFLRHRKWAELDESIAREGWKIIFLSQVHPLFPTSLLNYLYGVSRIPFRTCMLWVALGQAPGLFLYAYLGTLAQLGMRVLRGQTHPFVSEYVAWIGGLALTLVITIALGRLALRLLAEAEARVAESAPPADAAAGPTLPQTTPQTLEQVL